MYTFLLTYKICNHNKIKRNIYITLKIPQEHVLVFPFLKNKHLEYWLKKSNKNFFKKINRLNKINEKKQQTNIK